MKRRQFTSPSTLDLSNPSSSQSTPRPSSRAGSPSVFGAFLRGPTTRWFSKGSSKSSDNDMSTRQLPPSPRRPKISQPTDPRPFLDIPRPTQLSSSRSHSDLPMTGSPNSEEPSIWHQSASTLVATSRRSRSVDDLTKFNEAAEDPALVAQIQDYRNQHPSYSGRGNPQQFEFPRIFPIAPNYEQPVRRKESFDSPRKRSFSNNMLPRIGKAHHSSFSSGDRVGTVLGSSHAHEAHDGPQHTPDKSSNPSRPHFPHSNSNPVPTSRAWGLETKSSRPSTSPATAVRASQVIYRSGFLNQRSFTSPHDSTSLTKGWSPRKVLLKGTKLFFYKPPKDKAGDIRELFPTRLTAGAASESMIFVSHFGNGDSHSVANTVEGETSPKRRPGRAFRGRSRHPQLIVDEKSRIIKQGSPEAFLHEVIFGTTFGIGSPSSPADTDAWREFASTLLIVLPSDVMMGRARFENELIAHITTQLQGIDGDPPSLIAALGRADWIVSKYSEYWGQLRDRSAFLALRAGVISRANAISYGQQFTHSSHGPLTTAVDIPLPESPSVAQIPPPFPKRSPTLPSPTREHAQLDTALQEEGFSPDIMDRLPAEAIASSLSQWHHSRVLDIVRRDDPLVATTFEILSLGRCPSDDRDDSNIAHSKKPSLAGLSCLFGTDSDLHWLTRLVFSHIFGPPADPHGVEGNQTVRIAVSSRNRGTTIAKWIEIAELCRRSGDDCTWMAVRSALSSRAVVRLERAWREVPIKLRKVVISWIQDATAEDDGRQQTLLAPWLGQDVNLIRTISQALRSRGSEATMAELTSLRQHVDGLVGRLRACLMTTNTDKNHLVPLWKQWQLYSLETKSALSLDQYLELSYSAETRTKINYFPHYWKPRSELNLSPLAPTDFPRPFPTLHLVPHEPNRAQPAPVGEAHPLSEGHFRHILDLARGALNGSHAWRRSADMSSQTHPTAFSDNEIGDTFVFAYNGEIVLKVLCNMPSPRSSQYHAGASRASPEATGGSGDGTNGAPRSLSRAPSVNAAMSGSLSRKASRTSLLSRRSSLPSLSRGPSFTHPEVRTSTSLVVAVSGGTLDRLIDVLIDGLEVTVSSTDDSGLSVGATRTLCVDRQDFESTWWATFRSFVSAFVFFELLRKRFLQLQYLTSQSPSTDRPDPRLRILDVMRKWILSGSGALDLLDDPELFAIWYRFLDQVAVDLARNPPNDGMLLSALVELRRISDLHTLSPMWTVTSEVDDDYIIQEGKYATAPPDIDSVSPEDLVDHLDSIAAAVMSLVTTGDLLAVCDMLEVQLLDRALFLPKEPNPSPEEVVPETMFTVLRNVAPSPSVSVFCHHDHLHKSFPSGIRLLLRMHATFRAWATHKLAAPGIGLRKREARIDLLLRAIEICRSRSPAARESDQSIPDTPTAPSFIEVALLAAIWSPESRAFSRAWANVASSRGIYPDSIRSLLVVPQVSSLPATGYVVDGGWLFEQLLGILSLPDTLVRREHLLVHFDKRRYLYAFAGAFTRSTSHPTSIYNMQITRLNNLLKDTRRHEATFQAAKDEAQREGSYASPSYGARRQTRPFQTLVTAQIEKNRKDRMYSDRLSKERKHEQRVERRQLDISRATNPPKQSGLNGKHQRGKKSMSSMSLFFRAVRPLSTAWASDRNFSRQRTASELDFPTTGKPSLVLSLNDAHASSVESDDRPYMFQILTEDGGRWLLQATTSAELDTWLQTISAASRKRSTYIPHALKPVPSEPVSVTPSRQGAVFGVLLDELIARENNGISNVEGIIPRVLELCFSEIERRGLTEAGLYRVSGGTGTVNLIRKMFDEGETPDFANDDRFVDIHAICATVKSFLRQLPDPLIPFQYHNAAIASAGIKDYVERLDRIRILVHSLPRAHFCTLHRLIQHLDCVTDYEESNFMHAEGLAICIAPNLLRSSDPMSHLAFMGPSTSFVKNLILLFHSIFEDEGEADAEVEVLVEEEEPNDQLDAGLTEGSVPHSPSLKNVEFA